MKSIRFTQKLQPAFAAAIVAIALSATLNAQVQTQTTTESETPEKTITVERGEVVYVSGNDLVVKMESGELRNFENVPESAKVSVDGKELGIHELKPGMKLERTTIKTVTPQTIKTVQTVTGRVWHVTPPTSVILTLEDGTNQQFKIPEGQKFNIDGEMTDARDLKKGMKVSATRIVEEPQVMYEEEKKITGTMPPPPAPAPNVPILIAVVALPAVPTAAGASQQAKSEQPKTKLPQTGSSLPLIGLLGVVALGASLGLRLVRRFA
ncbi:MAG TPA: LPXTG cell wall anchor domain-containing protein [Terriglobales bacterium]|jgi:LPXTG-motif cell wall-anchored protein|nr:LPXTG cell wall anchor domain-containing protein [Terriglobales bacterium]